MIWIIIAFILAGAAFGYLVYSHGWKGAVAIASAFGGAVYLAGADVVKAVSDLVSAF